MTKGKRFPAANKGEFDSHYTSRIAKPTRKSRERISYVSRGDTFPCQPEENRARFVNFEYVPSFLLLIQIYIRLGTPHSTRSRPFEASGISRAGSMIFRINVDSVFGNLDRGISPERERFQLMGRIFFRERFIFWATPFPPPSDLRD